MLICIAEAGGSVTSTPSLSARPKVRRCGLPGTSASKSVNEASVHSGALLDEPDGDVAVEPPLEPAFASSLPPPPHAAKASAPAPATRKDRRSIWEATGRT